ncbi:M50 family metallopeptidase [Yoonia sp. I 8.24]|uniref:M50 family metallopeptidase n=1 Tax=Yoonia sp. I 8.24 TaxID=1537229 RepID=UPI001EDE2ECA|nr:M50 family metallopeptidase [Yoonia sp. I 8.24]MCG3269335.1 M50 family metallopeptidase [Yoonia sp. I 8.24]
MRAFVRGHWQLIVLTVIVFALWQTPVMTPLKILVVFLHEASHAIAVLLTGGEVVSFSVNQNQGGMVWARGGNRFVTLTAGYLGSLLIGVGLLIAALRTTADRKIIAGLGIAMLLIAAFYIRSAFALSFTVATGGVMLLLAWKFGHGINDLCLRIIGLSSMFYVPYDIISDTILRAQLQSDARMLAEEFGGTTMIWGGIWLIVSVALIGLCLRYGLGRNSNLPLPWAKPTTSS